MSSINQIESEISKMRWAIKYLSTVFYLGVVLLVITFVLTYFEVAIAPFILLSDTCILLLPTFLLVSFFESKLEKFYQNLIELHQSIQNRGEIINYCIICNLGVFTRDETLQCPICFTMAHKTHLLEWVKIKGYCPNCGSNLKLMDFSALEKNINCIQS